MPLFLRKAYEGCQRFLLFFGYCVMITQVQIPVSVQFYKKCNPMLGLVIMSDLQLKLLLLIFHGQLHPVG